MNAAKAPLAGPQGYAEWLARLKGQIAHARQRAALAVNAELVQLYGRIGHDILQRQQTLGWGAKVVDRLARDLKAAFPDMRGWSSSNLKYMRFFALHCPDGRFGQQPADQLPWFHVVTLLTQLDDAAGRAWYAEQTVLHGWSRSTLAVQIKNRLHTRQGAAVTNFEARLPASESALAQETLKDPYLFDFLGLGDEAHEREIESGLIRHITRFLLGACRAWGVEAKIGPSEDSFCRIRRLIAEAMGQEAGEKWTAAVNLQPTLPKPDRLLDVATCADGQA